MDTEPCRCDPLRVLSLSEVADLLEPVITVDWLKKHIREIPHLKSGRGTGRAGRIGFTRAHVIEILEMLEQRPDEAAKQAGDWGIRSRRGIVGPPT